MLHLALNTAQEEKAAAQAQLATAMSTEEAAVAAAQAAACLLDTSDAADDRIRV